MSICPTAGYLLLVRSYPRQQLCFSPHPDDRGQTDPICPQTFLSLITCGQSPTLSPFRKLLETGRGKWSPFQQLVRRVSREYSEPLSSQASGRVMKKMRREKLAPAPPFSPCLCSCGTTLTCHSAWLHRARWLGLGGGRKRMGEGRGFVCIPLPPSLRPPPPPPDTPGIPPARAALPTTLLLHPAIFQVMEQDSESGTNPDARSPHSGVADLVGEGCKPQMGRGRVGGPAGLGGRGIFPDRGEVTIKAPTPRAGRSAVWIGAGRESALNPAATPTCSPPSPG